MRNVTLIGALLDGVLGVLKIFVGWIGHSQGLIADGFHSLSDLVTDAIVLIAAKYGSREADEHHPYGHERIQTVSSVALGAGLVVVSLGIGWDAVQRLISLEIQTVPELYTLIVAVVSIVSKEWIYRYTMRVARKVKSTLLEANAWHSRTDAFSSVVVVLGIIGSASGFVYLDAVAAIIVAALITKIGAGLMLDGIKELIDTGLSRDQLDKMREAMMNVEGVQGVHQLRTRKMGVTTMADVHILVNPSISVSEGHRIAEEVEKEAAVAAEDPVDVVVHIDPEDDQTLSQLHLPLREEVERRLRAEWAAVSEAPLSSLGIHYVNGKVDVELVVDSNAVGDPLVLKQSAAKLNTSLASQRDFGNIKVLMSIGE